MFYMQIWVETRCDKLHWYRLNIISSPHHHNLYDTLRLYMYTFRLSFSKITCTSTPSDPLAPSKLT